MAEPALHADETSWYAGRPGASLWVMANAAGSCYRVVPSRPKAAVLDLLADNRGILVSDRVTLRDDLTPVMTRIWWEVWYGVLRAW